MCYGCFSIDHCRAPEAKVDNAKSRKKKPAFKISQFIKWNLSTVIVKYVFYVYIPLMQSTSCINYILTVLFLPHPFCFLFPTHPSPQVPIKISYVFYSRLLVEVAYMYWSYCNMTVIIALSLCFTISHIPFLSVCLWTRINDTRLQGLWWKVVDSTIILSSASSSGVF